MEQPPEKPDRDFGDKDFERETAQLLDDAIGYAAWTYQYPVPNTGKKVDGYMENVGVLLEFDGDYYHVSPEELEDIDRPEDLGGPQEYQFYNDLRREELFYEEGYTVVRIWEKNVNERPDEVKRRLMAIEQSDWLPDGRYLIGWPDDEK